MITQCPDFEAPTMIITFGVRFGGQSAYFGVHNVSFGVHNVSFGVHFGCQYHSFGVHYGR